MEDFFAFETKTPKMKRFVTPIREMEKDFTDSPPSNPMENILIAEVYNPSRWFLRVCSPPGDELWYPGGKLW